jgi:3,4-dihydroxy 2-butanone 4-phosphate synthase/GTP cyclohydrolase II
MNEDGTMAKVPDLIKFSKKHKIKIVSIEDIIKYRRANEKTVKEIVKVNFPTKYGHFNLFLFEDEISGESHIAIVKGSLKNKKSVLMRIHSSCETGDIFHSLRCDCGEQLETALKAISKENCGIVLYMHQEGRGIGLKNKLKAYRLQDQGLDTVEANIALGFAPDLRDYNFAAQVLKKLQVKSVNLMTNNPKKVESLIDYGVKVNKRISVETLPNQYNTRYLTTKKEKMKHILQNLSLVRERSERRSIAVLPRRSANEGGKADG